MSNTIRIRTTPNGGDKYLKVKLEQDWDFIEILSLKISQEDAYRKFCSDYGVIVGRVIINSGFGVPNAKVSVFIPIDEIDKDDPLIKGLYPYELLTDKDSDGIRYNLLPKESDSENDCYTPIGTFPRKREVLDNETLLSVYCKYYKFTTTTNHAGDFMIFGVPVGTHTVHLDADISDIGIASQRPYDSISQGTPSKMFQSSTKFKGGTNLDKLIQVKSLNAGVNVQPFWGDTENCEIGITRLDLDLNYNITPSAIFMGSIFGDTDKYSINKNCYPRSKLGVLCEQVAGAGSVLMIRKTVDGQIEDFDVEGGRVIDDDGTWSYQIPMNLDYMVTDEDGNLILSQDPNKGIPTRARVRFNIGMDNTGGEGRLRTRARYLVPNNPANATQIDYEFGPNTLDTSFRDLYWNKIYSVSNYIPRYQRLFIGFSAPGAENTNMTAIKNVDDCGDKTPFPYNRVKTETSPIYFIICLIVKIMGLIIATMNAIMIPIMNTILSIIYTIINAILSVVSGILTAVGNVLNFLGINNNLGSLVSTITPKYIPCIAIRCPTSNGDFYAPGCNKNSQGYTVASTSPSQTMPLSYFVGDNFGHTGFLSLVGLDDCIAFEIAKALGLFQFDFYNDWVNGTLFGFLLKYKKRKHSEKFCEYECTNGGFTPVDSFGNDCNVATLLDTGFPNTPLTPADTQLNSRSASIKDGLIKKIGNDLFYAATTHGNTGPLFKLFSTEIINLGSVFDCDWQGVPKIEQLLIPTTYKLPPDTPELDVILPNTNQQIVASGMVDIDGTTPYLFFIINCTGLHVDRHGSLNVRHICEMGVNIDEKTLTVSPDGIIGSDDIDDDRGKWFRDVFYGLNKSTTPWVTNTNLPIVPSGGYSSDFNTNNLPIYDFTITTNNGSDYIKFRDYNLGGAMVGDSNFGQTNHSYFFYFGLLPGKTGLDKMKERFFTTCIAANRDAFIIQATTIGTSSITASNGSITFTFIGGTTPFTYTITGNPPLSFTTINGTTTTGSVTINGLKAGTYIISAVDALGTPVSQTAVVSPPTSLYGFVSVTKNASTATSSDGEITISSVGGGIGPYTYEIKSFAGAVINGLTNIPLNTTPVTITGLAVDSTQGYVVTITDANGTTVIVNGLKVTGPSVLVLSVVSKTDVSCYSNSDGSITLALNGGQGPYSISNTGPNGYSNSSLILTNLDGGTYVTNVVDNLGGTDSITTNILGPTAPMVIKKGAPHEYSQQSVFSPYFDIPFYIVSGLGNGTYADIEYQLNNSGTWVYLQKLFSQPAIPINIDVILKPQLQTNIQIRIRNSASTCFSNIITVDSTEL